MGLKKFTLENLMRNPGIPLNCLDIPELNGFLNSALYVLRVRDREMESFEVTPLLFTPIFTDRVFGYLKSNDTSHMHYINPNGEAHRKTSVNDRMAILRTPLDDVQIAGLDFLHEYDVVEKGGFEDEHEAIFFVSKGERFKTLELVGYLDGFTFDSLNDFSRYQDLISFLRNVPKFHSAIDRLYS